MSDADKPSLRPANDNRWYCLATLYGEQPVDTFDDELASKNCLAWNRWIATALSDEERASLVRNGFPESELAPFSSQEKSAFYRAFAARTGRDNELPPEPTGTHDFNATHFDRYANFTGFLFWRDAAFRSATFSNGAEFKSATFNGPAEFFSASFSDDADFGSAIFSDRAQFNKATFDRAHFSSATFSRDSWFKLATFSNADFSSAKFFGDTAFDVSTFSGADFSSAKFFGNAEFLAVTFFAVDFSSATFSSDLCFINTKFNAVTTFAKSTFAASVPDFRGTIMHEATEWHGSIWPEPPHDIESAQAQVYAYERLKLEMERLKKHEDEQFFFRKELRSRRVLTRPLSGKWSLNFLYQISSSYGLSVALPVIWLLALFVLGGATFYFVHATTPDATALTIQHAAALSFGNIFPFVPSSHDFLSETPFSGWFRIEKAVGVGQTLIGTPLLFLLGLALRNRFRMK
jgi:Pentapeptide repeats (9 copies)